MALTFLLAAAASISTAVDNPAAAGRADPARCARADGELLAATPLARQMDALLSRYAEYGFSGSVLVVRDGQLLLNRGYGWSLAEERVANSPATLFDGGSLAKTFTAAAILDLEARGRLSTADPLSRFLPGLPADKQGITLHHLLTHRAGFPLDVADVGGGPADTTAVLVAKAAAAPLLHAPGSAYEYSNLGYGLLALVIERVSGQSWQRYVRRRLLDRARLRNTILWGEPIPRRLTLARGYLGPTEEEAVAQPALTHGAASPLLWGKHPLGAGGIYTSTQDLYRWWCALNGDALLPAAQRTRLFSAQAPGQGYGWNLVPAVGPVEQVYRGGVRGSYVSLVSHYPQSRSLIIYATNRNVSNLWGRMVWASLGRALNGRSFEVPPALARVPRETLERRAGIYRLGTGGLLHVRLSASALYLGAEGQDAVGPLAYAAGARPPDLPRLHQRSEEMAAALVSGDWPAAQALGSLSAEQVRSLRERWTAWTGETGDVMRVALLGSTPGAENHTRTFLRLVGPRGEKVIRFLWNPEQGRLMAWGDDIPLPAYSRLWPQSGSRFVSYDFETGRTLTLDFAADGALVVGSAGGEQLVAAARR